MDNHSIDHLTIVGATRCPMSKLEDNNRTIHLLTVRGPARRDTRTLEGGGVGLVGAQRHARGEVDRSRTAGVDQLLQVPRRQRERTAEAPHTRAGRQEDISPLVARDCLASDHLAEEFVGSSALFGLISIEVL